MRLLAATFSFVVASALAPVARADGYAWGGTLGRVSVHVQLSGFNEGAGVGGWRLEDARGFATWAARVEALLPAGMRVEITQGEPDGELVARFAGPRGNEELPLGLARAFPGDLDSILPAIAAHLRTPLAAAESSARVYTVQVFAAARPEHAHAFARGIDARSIDRGTDFFYETCLPCAGPTAHVLDASPRGLHRVVVGLHTDRGAARRSLVAIRALGLHGFVRAL